MTKKTGFLGAALFVLTGSLIGASTAEAYIPSNRTIFNRTAKNSGKGAYAIEQEVQFRSLAEPVTLRERWIVDNGETMRLYVSSPKSSPQAYKFDVLYRENKRTAPDGAGSLRTTGVGPEFIESFQHYRSGRGLMEALVRSKIVPGSFLRERPRVTSAKDIKHQADPLVRLGRSGGVVTWIFGEPSPAEGTRLNPAAWIEQDAFLLRKLRFPSQAEVTADKYVGSAGALQMPRERTINWENNTVVIRTISVKPLAAGATTAQLLAPTSVTPADAKSAKLPDQPQVKEFYSRFR